MKFNAQQPFGKVSPPMALDKWDTAAHYEQNGILYDSQQQPCDPDIRKAIEAKQDAKAEAAAAPKPAAKAKPAKKGVDAPAAESAPAPAVAGTGLDLAAWGRGQKDYLPPELFKAIRAKYNVQLSQRRDALDLLIKEKVITAAEARKDIV
jgi:hypothetical protein